MLCSHKCVDDDDRNTDQHTNQRDDNLVQALSLGELEVFGQIGGQCFDDGEGNITGNDLIGKRNQDV